MPNTSNYMLNVYKHIFRFFATYASSSTRGIKLAYCYTNSRPSVCLSVMMLGCAKTVRDSALVTMGS